MMLDWVTRLVPPRAAVAATRIAPVSPSPRPRTVAARTSAPVATTPVPVDAIYLAYEACDWSPADKGRIIEALYGRSRRRERVFDGYKVSVARLCFSSPWT
jgi:hypothetical protein